MKTSRDVDYRDKDETIAIQEARIQSLSRRVKELETERAMTQEHICELHRQIHELSDDILESEFPRKDHNANLGAVEQA